MTLTWIFRMDKVECKYANQKSIHDFIYDEKVMFSISVIIYYIRNRNVHDLDYTSRTKQGQM